MSFQLPEQLPTASSELDALLDAARADIEVIRAQYRANRPLTEDDLVELNRLLDATAALNAARDDAATREAEHAAEVTDLMERADAALTTPEPPQPEPEQSEAAPEPVPEPLPEPVPEPVAAAVDIRPVNFTGVGTNLPAVVTEPGWEMDPSCPGYRSGMGRVGFAELARVLDKVAPGSRSRNRPNKPTAGAMASFSAQVLARLGRDMPVIDDSHALVAAIRDATNPTRYQLPVYNDMGVLIAAGGWCSPSEQLYTFCDVPNASDLVSLPDLVINRGGIRWPVEPDLTALFASFEWFYTEPELEAVDSGDGTPTAIKTCVDIPCPDEFEEIRLAATGFCVEAGILQTQGWPELIEWFMQSLVQEHLRSMSRRTILDVVSGSTSYAAVDATLIGVVSAVLNVLALNAANIRLQRGLPRNALVEGIAPAWLLEAMRADIAMTEGLDTKEVTDARLIAMFTARNLAIQWVGDWQSRGQGEPGDLATQVWPTSVNVLLYPAGTWFRSLSPVIELGVMYPKEQLQVNRYTRFFVEDAIAVGHRCGVSLNIEIPICVSGAISDRQAVLCSAVGSVALPS